MRRIILAILLTFIAASAWALGDQPLIDPAQKKIDEEMNQKIAECQKKYKKEEVVRRLECGKQVRYEYQKKGVVRGTKEYFEVRYKKLNSPDLTKLRETLVRQKETARTVGETDSDSGGRKPGEITKEVIQNEILDIDLELRERKAHRKQ